MNERMLAYCLREVEAGVRIMARDKSPLHMFDYGTDPTGVKHVFVMAILPEEIANRIAPPELMRPSEPLENRERQSDKTHRGTAGGKKE